MNRLDPMAPYAGEIYYDQPALKPSPWDWTVSGYIFLAGLSGAAQALAFVTERLDPRSYRGAIRNARLLATFGAAIGSVLLIIDLRTPQRWYNMLRILRPTSPMSLGTYILSAFGVFSSLTVLGDWLRGRRWFGRTAEKTAEVAQAGAAVTGAGAATYTAALLSATSTPYWAAAPRQLGIKFATSAIAAGAAALSLAERLAGRQSTGQRFDDVAALATVAHMAASLDSNSETQRLGVADALDDANERHLLKAGDLLIAGAIPLAAYALNGATGNRSPGLSILGSSAILAGGFLVRHAVMKTGMESARRPEAQFRFAQPENLPPRCAGGGSYQESRQQD